MAVSTGRILIADDEPALLKMMSMYLGRRGYSVSAADTAESAWSLFEPSASEFAVAVLDATMPGLTLDELAIRMLHANPALHLIAASGYPVDMTAMEAAAPGRVMFLHKPFVPDMLVDAVRRMIAAQEKAL